MTDAIVIGVLLVIIGFAAFFVIRSKKSGRACIGCPHAKTCTGRTCSCGNRDSGEEG